MRLASGNHHVGLCRDAVEKSLLVAGIKELLFDQAITRNRQVFYSPSQPFWVLLGK